MKRRSLRCSRRCGSRRSPCAAAPAATVTSRRTGGGAASGRAAPRPIIAEHQATAVVGFCGAVDPSLAPGDLVVASAVRAVRAATSRAFPGAAMLAGALRRAGLRADVGPVHSVERLAAGSQRTAFARRRRARRRHGVGVAGRRHRRPTYRARGRAGGRPTHRSTGCSRHVCRGNVRRAARSLRAATPVLERWAAAVRPRRVVVASPRGFCAGVERAIAVVERALERYGPPIYVRRHIIHNTHVVADLAGRGAVFVEELDEVPAGSRVVFAAHGVAPGCARGRGPPWPADDRRHLPARRQGAQRGAALRGEGLPGVPDRPSRPRGGAGHHRRGAGVDRRHRGRPRAPTRSTSPIPDRVAYVTQTTLAVDEVADIVDRLRARFPAIEGPARDDICYATQNRQDAARDGRASATSSSSSVRRRRRTPSDSSRSSSATAAPPTCSTTTASSIRRGSPAPTPSASPPARRRPRRWCSG